MRDKLDICTICGHDLLIHIKEGEGLRCHGVEDNGFECQCILKSDHLKEKRTIKFRSWNRELKKMDYSGGFLYNHFEDINIHDCKHIYLNIFISDILDQFDLMQYIGRLDKYGREIYEGDIVRWKESFGIDKNVVKNDDILGLVMWNREYCRFNITQLTKGKWLYKYSENIISEHDTVFYSIDGAEFCWEDLEIIGNKYENPGMCANLTEDL